MPHLSDEDKEGLSAEEIAAIEDDSDEDSTEADDEPDKTDEADQEKDDEPGDAPPTEDDQTKSEEKPAEPEPEPAVTDVENVDDDAPYLPQVPTPDAKAIEAAKAAFEEAKTKFEEGEIRYDEFDKAKTAYDKLTWQAEMAESINKGARESAWQAEQSRFFRQNPDYGADKPYRNAAFVTAVNKLLATDEGAKLSDRKLLAEAKRQVEAEFGIATKDPAPAQKKPAVDPKAKALEDAKKTKAAQDRKASGVDMGELPAAADEADRDEFAWLDRLSGEKYMAALEKLTPEQMERYESR